MKDREIQTAWEMYEKCVDRIADDAFKCYVKPVCEKHGYTFVAGNGTWFLGTVDGLAIDGDYISRDIIVFRRSSTWVREMPCDDDHRKMFVTLTLEVPGFPANDLGSLMPDWRNEYENVA